MIPKGFKHSKETKQKMSKSHTGMFHTEKEKKKISKSLIGNKYFLGHKHSEKHKKDASTRMHDNKIWTGKKHSFETIEKMKKSQIGVQKRVWENIKKEIPAFEMQNYRVIPIGKVIPDMIIVKWNWETNTLEIKAVEIEYGVPRYNKYKKENYKNRFDDVIWLLRGEKHQRPATRR